MINILYAGNIKVFDGLLISVLSMVKHTSEPLNITCLTMDLHELDARYIPLNKEHEDYINKIIKEKNAESKFTLLDMTEEFKKDLIHSVNIGNHFTPFAMLRLLSDKIDMPDKYIYLDTDTVINNDIKELNEIDIENYELGAVRDAYRINRKYFNSGVLLVNQKMCLETKLFEKARKIVIEKKLVYTDQTALNMSCTKRLMLPLKFNSKDKWYPEIVVHHFCNVREKRNWFHRIKPWEVDEVKKKMSVYNDILDDYLNRKSKPDYPKCPF